MTSHVTVGVDGSPEGLAAAEWAADEALLRKVPLCLVNSDEWPMSAAVPVAGPTEQLRWVDRMLDEAADDLRRRRPTLEITTRRLCGRPAAALSVEAGRADMLVLGFRGLSGFAGFLIGSVGVATISATEQPVVLVRAPRQPDEPPPVHTGPYRDLVVGVDIHQSCDKLLAFAFDEAARRDCALQAVYAWKVAPLLRYAPNADPGIEREMARQFAGALGDLLAPWRERFPSVKAVERTLIGAPAQQLVESAADADLVVVGRRIRRTPLGAHIGPVAHGVMHHCAAPIAVVAHD
ncbi:universal stress protein [Streptomyces sp. NPDC001970]